MGDTAGYRKGWIHWCWRSGIEVRWGEVRWGEVRGAEERGGEGRWRGTLTQHKTEGGPGVRVLYKATQRWHWINHEPMSVETRDAATDTHREYWMKHKRPLSNTKHRPPFLQRRGAGTQQMGRALCVTCIRYRFTTQSWYNCRLADWVQGAHVRKLSRMDLALESTCRERCPRWWMQRTDNMACSVLHHSWLHPNILTSKQHTTWYNYVYHCKSKIKGTKDIHGLRETTSSP